MLRPLLRRRVNPARGTAERRSKPETLKIAGATLAALWTLFLYLDHRQDGRVERTLKYVERVHNQELTKARHKLEANRPSVAGVATLFAKSDLELRANAVNRVRKEKLEKEVLIALELYSEIALCARTGLCDQETACAYFSDTIGNFYQTYFPWIEVWGLASRADLLSEITRFSSACQSDHWAKRLWRYIAPTAAT
jgi:hypothetical protein